MFIVAIHLIFIVIASYLAFWLRYDGKIPDWALALFAKWLPVLFAMRVLAFVPFGVFDGIWRYTSVWDLRNIAGATSTFGF